MDGARTIITTVRLKEDEHKRLTDFAECRGRASCGSVLRQALLEYLARHEPGQEAESGVRVYEAQDAAL